MLPGIKETVVGYTGGDNPEPTYESVCLGDGHSEALQVEYDESEISYEDLVGFFFRGHPVNTMHPKKQYKSAIMFHNQEQKEIAAKVLREKKMGVSEQDLLQPASSWHDAEEYHQKYTQRQNFWFYGD
mmetsp:Transcript_126188/g.243253  ORF Transcript_126188/g.243253 Transcript_126188/m.243253 type:complete len:128 (-) Transcript_126188:340-723(-)